MSTPMHTFLETMQDIENEELEMLADTFSATLRPSKWVVESPIYGTLDEAIDEAEALLNRLRLVRDTFFQVIDEYAQEELPKSIQVLRINIGELEKQLNGGQYSPEVVYNQIREAREELTKIEDFYRTTRE